MKRSMVRISVINYQLASVDTCLEPGEIEVPKMLDLQTKSAIDSTEPLVLL